MDGSEMAVTISTWHRGIISFIAHAMQITGPKNPKLNTEGSSDKQLHISIYLQSGPCSHRADA